VPSAASAQERVIVLASSTTACPAPDRGALGQSDFGVLPTVAIGGRIHFGENAAFTARIGYPTTTLGFSFL
jgi:hypothetical protein